MSPHVVPPRTAISLRPEKPELDFALALERATAGDRSLGGLILEMARLTWGAPKIKPEEYFTLGLHAEHLSREEKATFRGRAAQDRLLKPHTTSLGAGLADDKLRYELLLRGAGLPAPRTRAVIGSAAPPDISSIRSSDELEAYLSAPDRYPLFAKPMHGIRSGGTALLRGFDADSATVRVGPHRVALQELAAFLLDAEDAYLLQDLLRPDDRTRAWGGDKLMSTRIVVTTDSRDEVSFHAALAKIPVGSHDVDNFWRAGNIAAGLDLDSGRIVRAVSMADGLPVELTSHPDTGAELTDLTMPGWSDLKALVAAAAPLFAGLRVQAWDVALADQGPVPLEVNIGGDFSLPQVALGRGIATDAFMQALRGGP
ncbi:MAG: sugar-transfer associated ATP-grasp domain-containing protein [Longimicrobiales bacterium]|nr:sugar-transfer associated ATP-grasp domain-containing protein [Longimicrobiales bacterium]